MTAAATILAVLLIAAVIYILVQAELHHEDAGTIRAFKSQAAEAGERRVEWQRTVIASQRDRIASLSTKAAAWDQLDAGTKRLIEALSDPDWSAS